MASACPSLACFFFERMMQISMKEQQHSTPRNTYKMMSHTKMNL